MPTRLLATSIGLIAILLWAVLALTTALASRIPSFELLGLTFAVATAMGAISWLFRPGAASALRQPLPVWALGVGGLFGYHAVYFAALKRAPAAEASLIAYLWPLLIVLFSAMLPGERLRWYHVAGALLGFAGVLVLGLSKGLSGFDTAAMPGYLLALACAFIWSGYSVLSRRFKAVPTDAVVGFCGMTCLLALLFHGLFEETIWPEPKEWLAIIGLGLGPVGLAFYAWDRGVKHGDIRLLGVASYATPVLSTLILVLVGFAPLSLGLGLAVLLIVGGALLASRDQLFPPRKEDIEAAFD
ncbi:DMT family transporter [Labrys okinawensis]|uniref:aromatic amino acid exporter YddG n=1 Tax=Labrys okinawensis TaxID=346911 RepID=UPI0039BC4053